MRYFSKFRRNKFQEFPFISQANMMDCGTTCLAMIFKYYGYYNVRSLLGELGETTTEGLDLYTVSEIAEDFGFRTDAYDLAYEHLQDIHLPCIAHYEGKHFIIVYRANEERVWVADPAFGKGKIKSRVLK